MAFCDLPALDILWAYYRHTSAAVRFVASDSCGSWNDALQDIGVLKSLTAHLGALRRIIKQASNHDVPESGVEMV